LALSFSPANKSKEKNLSKPVLDKRKTIIKRKDSPFKALLYEIFLYCCFIDSDPTPVPL
jgi:hypothetical protein